MNTDTPHAVALPFNIAAMGLAAATIALVILDAGDGATYSVILAVGLWSLAVGSVMHQQRLRREK